MEFETPQPGSAALPLVIEDPYHDLTPAAANLLRPFLDRRLLDPIITPISEEIIHRDHSFAQADNLDLGVLHSQCKGPTSLSCTAVPSPSAPGPTPTHATASAWLNTAADDEVEPVTVQVINTVKKLITEAQKYKSFSSLMHLHAVQPFIEFCKRYKLNPKIKNPVIRASHGGHFDWERTVFCS